MANASRMKGLTAVSHNGIPFGMRSQSEISARASGGPVSTVAPGTPFIRIDEGVLTANLRRLAAYGAEKGIALRPHAKTHKSQQIARMQLDLGAIGLAAAKVSEAEVLAEVCSDMLLAYPVVDAGRAERAAELAKRIDLKVALDSAIAAELLSAAADRAGVTVGVLVDQDVGLHRTGVQSSQAALELATKVDQLPGLCLRGLFFYPGHIWDDKDKQQPALNNVAEQLEQTLELWRARGLNAQIVSGGSTPTAYQSHLIPQCTEIRPGTYPYNDMNTVRGGYCTIDQCAARVIVSVVSDAVPGQVVIDSGSKTLTSDRCVPQPESGHGLIIEYPDARITKLSEEHGQVDVSQCDSKPRIGERLSVIPNHICPCINLQDTVWLDSGDGPLTAMPIHARGKLS